MQKSSGLSVIAGGIVLALLAPFSGCGGDGPDRGQAQSDASTPPSGGTSDGAVLGACEPGGRPAEKASGYLLITEPALAKIREAAAANRPAFEALKRNVERYSTDLDVNKSGAENAALLYLLTNEQRYADTAYAWAKQVMERDLRGGENGNYLEFGDMMRSVALVLNWAKAGLTAEQVKELADYLDASTTELWVHPGGSKWALDDDEFSFAGNNFRMAFIEGTAFAGYALQGLGDARGEPWVKLAIDKLERKGGVFEYIDAYQIGGDWLEGSNYGQRSKQRLFRALALIASMGGENYFQSHPFFANAIVYAVYQAQPGNTILYPGGDLARSALNPVSPYDREYVQLATYWLCDSPSRRLGQHYLTQVASTYEDGKKSFDYEAGFYLDLVYAIDIPAFDVTTLPLSYRAAGTNWVNARSGWDAHATSVSISGSPIFTQSHQHMDMGSFVIWKDDWLAVDPETFDGNGPFWPAEAHQGLFVPNRELRFDDEKVPGLLRFADTGKAVYAQVDDSKLYRRRPADSGDVEEKLLNEHTRELVYLRPNTVVVFDRVDAKPAGEGYSLRFHFPSAPDKIGESYTSRTSASGITFAPLLGGAVTVSSDDDLGSRSHRIEQAATGTVSRFFSVLEVASGAPPAIAPKLVGDAGGVRGAVVGDSVVVFSDLPRGATPSLPVSYTVPGVGKPTHVIANLAPNASYAVTASRAGEATTVTIAPGAGATADAEGVLVVAP